MRKTFLTLGLAAIFMTAAAQNNDKVWFQTDFGFLEPYTAQRADKKPIGDPMADDGMAGFHKEVEPYRLRSTKVNGTSATEAI